MDKNRILIIGGSGLLGSNAARIMASEFEVYATYLTQKRHTQGCEYLSLDVRDGQWVNSVITDLKPDLIIHAAGLTDVDYCETSPSDARMIHVDGTWNVASASQENDAKMIYISTDSIFDGEKGSYDEKDSPHPISVYAKTKLEGELKAQQVAPHCIVVRTAFYGWNPRGKPSLAEWIVNNLRQKKHLKMWTDVIFSPILVDNLIEVMVSLYRKGASGVYHIGGSEGCSKYSFGKAIASAFELDGECIEPASIESASFVASRPRNLSLDVTKILNAQDIHLLNVNEGIARFKELESLIEVDTGTISK